MPQDNPAAYMNPNFASLIGPNIQPQGTGLPQQTMLPPMPQPGVSQPQQPQPPMLDPQAMGELGMMILAQQQRQADPYGSGQAALGQLTVPSTNTQSTQFITDQILQRQLQEMVNGRN